MRGAKRLTLWRWPRHAVQVSASCLAAERDRWILWTPVIFGCGIAVYFSLDFEPVAWLGPILSAAVALLLVASRRSSWLVFLLLGALIATLGFSAGQLRSHLVAAPY